MSEWLADCFTWAPATGKVRSPRVRRRVVGTSSAGEAPDYTDLNNLIELFRYDYTNHYTLHTQFAESIFYRETACNAMRGIARLFCPSVRLPVCRVPVCQTRELWHNERNLCSHSYTAWKTIHSSFLTKKWLVGATPSTRNSGPNWPCWSENANFQSIFARSVSVITTSKKVQLTLIGSPLRAFQWA